MSERTLEQLDEQIDAIKDRLQQQIGELVDIICNDLPEYVLKNVRRAFIEDVDTAEQKTDAELAEFKARVTDFGRKLADDIRRSLTEDMEIWWGGDVSIEAAGKTLDGNEAVRSRLAVISERVASFLQAEKFRQIEVVYHTPARFIDGKYPPGMIEKYWSQLAVLRTAEEERSVLDREARKARLASRWDSI